MALGLATAPARADRPSGVASQIRCPPTIESPETKPGPRGWPAPGGAARALLRCAAPPLARSVLGPREQEHGVRSSVAVWAGIGGNLAVTVTKFVAAASSGSASILAESFHSLVDTLNQSMMLLGLRLSRKLPDENHQFGHSKDLYFWSLIVATALFSIGGGVSVLEGVERILEPKEIESIGWTYAVIGLCAIFEATSLGIAYDQLRKQHPDLGTWQAIRRSKDPSTFTVACEDSAALVGLAWALLGVMGSHLLGIHELDGVGSILVGLTLAAVAVVLIKESRGLLLGEAADPKIVEGIKHLVESDPAIECCRRPMTMHLGPDDILLNLDLQFRGGHKAEQIETVVDRLEQNIRKEFPAVQRIFLEVEALMHPAGDGQACEAP